MTELVFIEGISGVGKSTMVRRLANELRSRGYSAKEYVEFDYTNPIDFYCTAYLTNDDYVKLCEKYSLEDEHIKADTVDAGRAKLIRYFNEDTPLFGEPILSELREREFCYDPKNLIPMEDYTEAYFEVWSRFVASINESYDFIIFDGSLLHHPINDMMRNYNIVGEQAIPHVRALLSALGTRQRRIFYLKVDNIAEQLKRAHIDRSQEHPSDDYIRFWKTRYQNDMTVLQNVQEDYCIFNVSCDGWDTAGEQILNNLIG